MAEGGQVSTVTRRMTNTSHCRLHAIQVYIFLGRSFNENNGKFSFSAWLEKEAYTELHKNTHHMLEKACRRERKEWVGEKKVTGGMRG